MLYVGANDGMLHGFNATTGDEVFAYLPGPIFKTLRYLSDKTYQHRYYVDGSPNSMDAYIKGRWRTVLAGGLNFGGKGIYALDVTDPKALLRAEDNAHDIVLWEYTSEDDADLGYTFSQPAIARLHNGKWAAIFGNGYDDTWQMQDAKKQKASRDAALFIINLEDGSVLKKITIKSAAARNDSGKPQLNGLATPALVDVDGDGIVDYVFAGDLQGGLWKFDLTSANASEWDSSFADVSGNPLPLFRARGAEAEPQSIVERPEVIRGPTGNDLMVLFGTSNRVLPTAERLGSSRVQTFYGIVDRNTGAQTDRVESREILQRQTILSELATNSTRGNVSHVRITSEHESSARRGWYLDLAPPANGFEGEEQMDTPIVRNGRVIFTTQILGDNDLTAAKGWLMELDALSGNRLKATPFDLNGNEHFMDSDKTALANPDGLADKSRAVISGIRLTKGFAARPTLTYNVGDASLTDLSYIPTNDGHVYMFRENPGPGGAGRQSWRQLR